MILNVTLYMRKLNAMAISNQILYQNTQLQHDPMHHLQCRYHQSDGSLLYNQTIMIISYN